MPQPAPPTLDAATFAHMRVLADHVLVEIVAWSDIPGHRCWMPTKSVLHQERNERQGWIRQLGPDAPRTLRVGDWCHFLRAMKLDTQGPDVPENRSEGRWFRVFGDDLVTTVYATLPAVNIECVERGEGLVAMTDRVIVEPVERKSLIVLPDRSLQGRATDGKVLAVGPDCDVSVATGDVVLFDKFAGNDVKMRGVKRKIVHQCDLFAAMEAVNG